VHELTRRVITRFIESAIGESRERIALAGVANAAEARGAARALVALSPALETADADVKRFLFANMYRHDEVKRVRTKADQIVRGLYEAYTAYPSAMPPEWAARALRIGSPRAAGDYIAGMTDRFALGEYRRLFDPTANLR